MEYETFIRQYIQPFEAVNSEFIQDQGFIVWRLGTGNNVELLHIKTFKKGKGYGRKLFYTMLDGLKQDLPYHSIFGFTRVGNSEARAFYGALGFWLQPVTGLYQEGSCILFCQGYDILTSEREQYEQASNKRQEQ